MENYGFLAGLAYLTAIAAFVVFVWNLQTLLRRCAPGNRALRPALVWLQVVPVFGAIWQFFVVRALSESLGAESRSRGWQVASRPSHSLGTAKATVDAVALAHVLGFFAILLAANSMPATAGSVVLSYFLFASGLLQLASIALWATYWSKMSKFSSSFRWFPAR